ncbi:MAG: SUMF1/EgtB/PvdO family nonheme iron enzyme, partial [Saprospiraceae bacterium]|nr:SUMF1/EgtB/PvdO family nonheme iron enzyme [Saprospiraceae bacterium]
MKNLNYSCILKRVSQIIFLFISSYSVYATTPYTKNSYALSMACNISQVTATTSNCLYNVYTVSGNVTFIDPPTTGTLTVTVAGGGSQTFNPPFVSPLAYSISGQTADGISHTITATFSAIPGCTLSQNYTAPAAVNAVITPNSRIICSGQSQLLTATGGAGYLWNIGQSTAAITVSPTVNTTYTVTVSNPGGCTDTAMAFILVNPSPSVTITGINTVCAGGSSTFTANVTGGTAPYTYAWSNFATTQSITANLPFTYTVTVTGQNGCTATASQTLTFNVAFGGAIGSSQTICSEGDPAAFTNVLSGSGSGTVTYQWQYNNSDCGSAFTNLPGAVSATLDIAAPLVITTNYRRVTTSVLNGVVCTANSNCVTVTVNSIAPGTITQDQTMCAGGNPATFNSTSPAVGSGTITYQWQKFSGLCCTGIPADKWVEIGNPNNPADGPAYSTTINGGTVIVHNDANQVGRGSVPYSFYMMEENVTYAQYLNFLNSADPTNIRNLNWGFFVFNNPGWSYPANLTNCGQTISAAQIGSLEIHFVSYNRSARFANWVATGNVNQGAYTFADTLNGNSNITNINYNYLGPKLPNDDEWYKAAYWNQANNTYELYGTTQFNSNNVPVVSNVNALGIYTVANGHVYQSPNCTFFEKMGNQGGKSAYGCYSMCTGYHNFLNPRTVTYPLAFLCIRPNNEFSNESGQRSSWYNQGTYSASTTYPSPSFRLSTRNAPCVEGAFIDIPGATGLTYDDPGPINTNTSFRRVAKSLLNGVECIAKTNCVTVYVNTGNPGSIAADQTICSGGDPVAFTSVPATGNGTITYQWQSSTTGCGGTFSNIAGATSATYDAPSGITQNTTYRRVATFNFNSLNCSVNSNCVTITVNAVSPGTISADQTICSGVNPSNLTGTVATGSGAITYQWQSSTTGCAGTFTNIPGATSQNYNVPAGLSVNTSYKRIATSTLNGIPCSLISNCVTININNINPGSIAASQTICSGGDPVAFTSTVNATGAGTITYQWQSRTGACNGSFSDIGGATSSNYDPPSGLLNSTAYRRLATSTLNGVSCTDSSNCVIITINDISPGNINVDQTICSGGNPNQFNGGPAIGAGTITYQWQSNTSGCGSTFTDIAGATSSTYDPPAGLTVTTYYRRIGISTLNGVACSANSNCLVVTVNDFNPGSIAADQTICSGGDPVAFTSVAASCSGTLTYQWQSNTTGCAGSFTNIAGATSETYDPPSGLSVTTYYRRVATCTINGVPCGINSNCVTVTVNTFNPGSIAADQTICSGGDPVTFTSVAASCSGTLTYQWQSNTTGCVGSFTNIAGATLETYDPPAGLTQTTYYRRVATCTISGNPCSINTNCVTVTVNIFNPGSIAADQTICSGGDPVAFTSVAASCSGTLTYQWQSNTIGCAGSFTDIAGATSAAYDPPSGLTVTTYYRRVATCTINGVPCGINSNCVTVTVNTFNPGSIAADQTICSGGDPVAFTSVAASCSGTLTYQWQSNTIGCAGSFTDIAGATSAAYDPPSGLTVTTYYRRVATCTINGVPCGINSNCVTVTVNTFNPGSIAADQTICSGGDPVAFTSVAASCSGTLTYQWQSNTTGCAGSFTNIVGATSATYDPPSGLTVTTYYRRVATCTINGVPCGINSNCVTVTINTFNPGSIAADQTICSGGDPVAFTSVAASCSGTLTYQWQSNTTGCAGSFTNIAGATSATYDPPSGLTVTTYYRRVATCTINGVPCDINSNCVTVTVNTFNPGSIAADQTICSGGDPVAFTSVAASCSGTLTYQWQSNTTGCAGSYTDIVGATSATYDPPSGLTFTTYYRRVATCTINGVPCGINSNCVTVTVNTFNPGSIAADQTICSGGDPIAFTSVAASCSGTLTYQWQSNTTGCAGSFTNIVGATSATYDPPSGLSFTTYYRRIATCTINGVACDINSNCVTVTVNTFNPGSIAADQTICSGGDPIAFTSVAASCSGTLTYQWQSNNTGCAGSFTNIAGATSATYDPPSGLTVTTYYRRVATCTINGVPCDINSNCVTVTVNTFNPGSIAADQTICSGGDPVAFTSVAASCSGTLTYQWQSNTTGCAGSYTDIVGATSATYDPPSGLTFTTYYRRVATCTINGVPCGINSNCVTVTVNTFNPGSIAADQTICSGGDPIAFTSVAASCSGTLTYQWQSNTTGCAGSFTNIVGATSATYDPPSGLSFTTYYRRIATCTINGVACD